MSRYDQRKQKVDKQLNAGRDINLSSDNPAVRVEECPVCGKNNLLSETFRCKRCQRPFICAKHLDEHLLVCPDCARQIEAEEQERKHQRERATGTIESIRVEGNVYVIPNWGMRIFVTFTVNNLKDAKCSVAAYFYYSTGQALADLNGAFRSADGGVAVKADFTPPYDAAAYKDFPLFLPHDELHISSGQNRLKFRIHLYAQLSNYHFAVSGDQFFNYNLSP